MRNLNVVPLTRPTDTTCVHTCLAMVLGIPIFDLIERFGDQALFDSSIYAVLVEHAIWPVSTIDHPNPIAYNGVYLLGVPSMHDPYSSHLTVVTVNDYGVQLFDPNKGRSDKIYTTEDLLEHRVPYMSVIYLDTERLSEMNAPSDNVARAFGSQYFCGKCGSRWAVNGSNVECLGAKQDCCSDKFPFEVLL